MRFLLTPLREGRRLTLEQLEMRVHISTHAPAGGATSGAGANGIARSHFYSRPCGRGDAHGRTYGSFRQISTHAPAGGATPPLPGGPTTYSFLLTPLREGRQLRRFRECEHQRISTHAPAGGATATTQEAHLAEIISTHAPAGGATRGEAGKKADWTISTHAPAGGATIDQLLAVPCKRISTHAPAGGATRYAISSSRSMVYFYSRPCGRGDP